MSPALPSRMTAIAIARHGGPEVLTPEQRELPRPGPGDILIRVEAAGVNRPDLAQRAGAYPPPPGASDLPGLEVSGQIVGLGTDVERWRGGEQVCALVPGGGYAEYVVTPAEHALPIPEGLDWVAMAAVPETFFTVWSNVMMRGGLRAGETLLVHGGASGIGTTAIMLGKAWGAQVIVTAGTPEKCEACRKLGADRAIDYRREDWAEAVRAATDGHGANVILDMVGRDYTARNLTAAAQDGRIVQIATMTGAKVEIDLRSIMAKRLSLTGSTLRPQSRAAKAAIARALEEHVWPWLASGLCRPVIHAVLPLLEASKAHAMLEAGEHVGKIVLTTSQQRETAS